ncbi:MAG: Stk1 family PASTA domain-containing Ser/Thr kinase [Coriobacteriia bacterium]|nr:Stk1 family PASTA domain-containing Ser/Thr kinase [Coriobacteriia bacterium]
MEDLVFGRRYRATEKIGTGGMADVYKSVDEVLGRTVAVKVLHARYAADPNFVARFRQEAQAAANLSHPNIVNIYDWGRDGETYYIVMEYVNGRDLKSLITERGPLDPLKAAEYAAQVCAALGVAHGYDIIHRDIKPHNIVLTPDGAIKVMDFGIARAGNTTMTQTGSVLGTAQYISPEQAQGRTLTPSSDLYSLGVTLYELVTGRVPFDGDTPVATALMQVNDEATPPRQVRGSIPPGLEAVILRAMRKDPGQRYTSAAEMRDDLKRVISGEPAIGGAYGGVADIGQTSVLPAVDRTSTPRAETPLPVRSIPERRTNPWMWVAIGALIIALGIAGAYTMGLIGNSGVVVPTLTGLTEEQAIAELSAAGLVIGELGTENDDAVEIGLIIRQDPTAGSKVEKGTAVSVVISLGIAQVEVPDFTTMAEGEAIDILRSEDSGLDYNKTIRENNADVPKGDVIRTEPATGAQVPKGTRVILYVSEGVAQVKVPNVVGKPQADATADIKAAGLAVKVNEVYHASVIKGSVVSQKPDADVLVEAGSTVTIEVSKGPEVILVPDVRGKTEAEAKSAIEAAGLVAKVVYVDSPDDGIVVNQFPIPGASASRGDTVEIEVGKLPEEP